MFHIDLSDTDMKRVRKMLALIAAFVTTCTV